MSKRLDQHAKRGLESSCCQNVAKVARTGVAQVCHSQVLFKAGVSVETADLISL